MTEVLLIDGVVESNSPDNRRKLYHKLIEQKIKYTTEIIGYTETTKYLNRHADHIGWDLGRVVKWIAHKRILPEDLKTACEIAGEKYCFEDVKDVFNPNMSNKERYKIIKEAWGRYLYTDISRDLYEDKYTPFDYCYLRKTIVRIKLI